MNRLGSAVFIVAAFTASLAIGQIVSTMPPLGVGSLSGDCTSTAAGVITCSKTGGTSFAAVATSGSASDLGTGTLPTARLGGLSAITNSLGSNTALNNSTYTNGPIIAQGTTGTWYVTGTVTLTDSATTALISCKIFDTVTTTNILSSVAEHAQVAGLNSSVSMSGFLATPGGSIALACKSSAAATSSMVFNASGNSKDSTLTGFRVNWLWLPGIWSPANDNLPAEAYRMVG